MTGQYVPEQKPVSTDDTPAPPHPLSACDDIPAIIWVTNSQGQIEFANRAFCEFFDVLPVEVETPGWVPFFHPNDADQHIAAFMNSLHNRQPFRGEVRARRGDGQWRWIDSQAQPRFTSAGEFAGMAGSSLDITDRINAEAARHEIEARFRLAFRAVPGIIYDWDFSQGSLYRSDGLSHVIGLSADELLPNLEAWTERIHPDDQAFVAAKIQDMLTNPEKTTFEGEYRVRHAAGHWVWVKDNCYIMRDSDGQVVRLVGATTDITSKKEASEALRLSEERLRVALIQTGVTVFSQDRDLRYTWDYNVHPAFSAFDRVGKTDADLYLAADADRLTGLKQNVLAIGQDAREEIDLTVGEELCSYDLFIIPVRDNQGEITGLLGSALDITERKKAEAEVQSYAEQLKRSNQELEEFAFVASHDLQEPLRKILFFSKKIGAGGNLEETEKKHLINRLQETAGRMHNMIAALLELSRVTTHQEPFIPVDLNQAAQIIVDDLYTIIQAVEGRIILHPLPTIDADPIQIQQILQNLVRNALKFHRPGVPPVVQVGYRVQSPGYVEIYVQDNGIGFDIANLDVIFQPFRRLHGRGEYEGAGLGLATCKKIVERHGGRITANSVPGEGTTFSAILPVKQIAR